MATVIGGMFHGWNSSLLVGFGSYIIAHILLGLVYVISFIFRRNGFINRIFKLEYVFYTSSLSAIWLDEFFVTKFHLSYEYQLLIVEYQLYNMNINHQ
jgi:hypothetical protein